MSPGENTGQTGKEGTQSQSSAFRKLAETVFAQSLLPCRQGQT